MVSAVVVVVVGGKETSALIKSSRLPAWPELLQRQSVQKPALLCSSARTREPLLWTLELCGLLGTVKCGKMQERSPLYLGTAAFVAGVVLTVSVKDVIYPVLQQHWSQQGPSRRRQDACDVLEARPGPPTIVDGIEGCIGNTPLVRIKSLSEETGCEILGKAEVWLLPRGLTVGYRGF